MILDCIRSAGETVVGFIDESPDKIGGVHCNLPIFDFRQVIAAEARASVKIANGIGELPMRALVAGRITEGGFQLLTVRHPSAVISVDAKIGQGAQVMAGAIIQPSARLDSNVLVNTKASIDHDCRIGPNATIAPGATLCGGVTVGQDSAIGAGAVILEKRTVGTGAIVAAGSVVVRDVPDNSAVRGVPARPFPI